MLKKTLVLAVFLALVFPVSAIPARAQTFTAEQEVTLGSLKQQIIDLLLAQIATLQEQIDALIAQNEAEVVEESTEEKVNEPVLGAEEQAYDVEVTTEQGLDEDLYPVVYFTITGEHQHATIKVFDENGKMRGPWQVQPNGTVSQSVRITSTSVYKPGKSFTYEVTSLKNRGSYNNAKQDFTGEPRVVKTGSFTITE